MRHRRTDHRSGADHWAFLDLVRRQDVKAWLDGNGLHLGDCEREARHCLIADSTTNRLRAAAATDARMYVSFQTVPYVEECRPLSRPLDLADAARLSDLIGQAGVLNQVRVALDAARHDGKKFDHALLVGPPGCSKTQTAKVVAEMGGRYQEVLGQAVLSPADLNALLLAAGPRDVFLVDEAHEREREFQAALFLALDQRRVNATDDRPPVALLKLIFLCPHSLASGPPAPVPMGRGRPPSLILTGVSFCETASTRRVRQGQRFPDGCGSKNSAARNKSPQGFDPSRLGPVPGRATDTPSDPAPFPRNRSNGSCRTSPAGSTATRSNAGTWTGSTSMKSPVGR